jgi:MFS superfamily sulfate permease-like transporter
MNIKNITYDFKSSIVVFLVAIPLCLGIALASNAPLSSGILSGIIGGIVVGIISGSAISVSGPAAGLTVLVATGIGQLGSFEMFAQAVIFAGLLQILMGVLRGGVIAHYFPTAVIKGMLAAIGIILIQKQLKLALGITSYTDLFQNIHLGSTVIASISIAIILLWEQYGSKLKYGLKLLPAALIAVITSIVLNKLWNIVPDQQLVQIPSNLLSDVKLILPQFNWDIIKVGISLSIVASLETLLCLEASEKIDPLKRKPSKNRELLAQGIGNTLSGFVGGLPITAVIVRTSANVSADAKSKFSTIMHGLWILLSVLLFSQFINWIPLPTLAAVLILVGFKLTKPSFFVAMKKRGNKQLIIFVSTIVAILMTDLLIGIAIGLLVSIIFEMKNFNFKSININESEREIHLDFKKSLNFWHKHVINNHLNKSKKTQKSIKITADKIHIDVKELLQEWEEEHKNHNPKIVINLKDL